MADDTTTTPATTGSPKTTMLGIAVLLGALLAGVADHFDLATLKVIALSISALGTAGVGLVAKDH